MHSFQFDRDRVILQRQTRTLVSEYISLVVPNDLQQNYSLSGFLYPNNREDGKRLFLLVPTCNTET